MTRVFEQECLALDHGRPHTFELSGESCLRVYEVNVRERVSDCRDATKVYSERVGNFEKDARDLDLFLFAQTNHLVVLIDNRKRLDEGRLAGRRKAMHDAGHLTARVGANRNHEAPISNGDDVFLDRRGRAFVHERFEIAIDSQAALVDFAAYAA